MDQRLRRDAETIVRHAIDRARPDGAVRSALAEGSITGNVYLAAVGKAAWAMANAAVGCLEAPVRDGIVLTKYGHLEGEIPGVRCLEAGHPVPDQGSFSGTKQILEMTEHLTGSDTVLLLLSGGGSALFEDPRVLPETLTAVTEHLLRSGASILELNAVRKRLSRVKAGRFAQWCEPAIVEAVILSDVLGDRLDVIASGPVSADLTTCAEAEDIGRRYGLEKWPEVMACLREETPKAVTNVHPRIIGSVRQLCASAAEKARELGYRPICLTDTLSCEARDAGRWLAEEVQKYAGTPTALIAGGETVVHVMGTGLGGRNQELALAAAGYLQGGCVLSAGSDGTDGPTDAAGGYADGDTVKELSAAGISHAAALADNDSYHALKAIGNLIFTGPTGTNVNDITIALIR